MALLTSGVAAAQCTMDTDCKGDRVCEQGKCTSPAAAPAPAAPAPGPDAATPPGTEAAPPPAEATPAPPTVTPVPAPAPVASAPSLRPVEPARPRDEPPVKRVNRTAMVSGIVMVSVGPLALLGALAARNAQVSCDEGLERDYPDHMVPTSQAYRLERCDSYSAPLYTLGISGALLIAAGVPLIIYGARTVPAAPQATLRLDPWASRTSGGLRLRLDL